MGDNMPSRPTEGAVLFQTLDALITESDGKVFAAPTYYPAENANLFLMISGTAHRNEDNADGRIGVEISRNWNPVGYTFGWASSVREPAQLSTFTRMVKISSGKHQQFRIRACNGTKFVQGKDFLNFSILEFAGNVAIRDKHNDETLKELCGCPEHTEPDGPPR